MNIVFVKNDIFDLQVKRWEGTFADIGEPALLVDKAGRVICANSTASSMFQTPQEIVEILSESIGKNDIGGKLLSFSIQQEVRWFDSKKTDFNLRRDLTSYLLIDVTDKVREREQLRISEEKYRLLTENASDVIWILNWSSEKFTYISPSVFSLRGYTAEESVNKGIEDALTPESVVIVKDAIRKHIKDFMEHPENSDSYIYEIQQPCKNGDIVWVEVSAKFRYNKDGDIEIVGVGRNIEERKRAEAAFLFQSYHDRLTGLYNRRYYEEELPGLDKAESLPLAFIVADLNGLKLINDAFGHQVGDSLLVTIGGILQKECGSKGMAARIGGDEFILLLPGSSSSEAEEIINRIHKAIESVKIDSIIVSISIGYSIKSDPTENTEDVFKKAEDEMYKNKLNENSSMRSQTVNLIMTTLCEKSEREMLHSKRVSAICEAIAVRMNFSANVINQVKLAGLMHDIGKIGIDEKILDKDNKLTVDERSIMQKHAEIGWRILSSVNEFSGIADYVLAHHEQWDGKGYPKGLSGEQIPICSRIIAIADAYDAMTSLRPYRDVAFTREAAVKEIGRCSGIQFDPEITRLFIEMILGEDY